MIQHDSIRRGEHSIVNVPGHLSRASGCLRRHRLAGHMLLSASLVVFALAVGPALAHEGHDAGEGESLLHFSHPLFTESPSPDSKLRVDYFYARLVGEAGDDEEGPPEFGALPSDFHTFRLEGEYAFTPSFSIEVNLPFSVRDAGRPFGSRSHFDNGDIGLKYANYSFADRGLLLGGGIEVGLPLGQDEKGIGSDHIVDLEPFLDFGWKRGRLEMVGFLTLGLPLNDRPQDAAPDAEIAVDLSALYHVSRRVSLLVELNGEHVEGGEEDGLDVWNIAPGFKFAPVAGVPLQV
ncbi:MAG: hypothetical protein D6757_01310, partial [Alphaproteobacteria bacterium]